MRNMIHEDAKKWARRIEEQAGLTGEAPPVVWDTDKPVFDLPKCGDYLPPLFVADEATALPDDDYPVMYNTRWRDRIIAVSAPVEENPVFYRVDPPADEPTVVEGK